MTRHRTATLGLLAFLALPLAPACTCSKSSEPTKTDAFDPTTENPKIVSPPPVTPAQDAGMNEAEYRDWHMRLHNELCEAACKRINTVAGKPETDPNPKAINTLSNCLRFGNVAWYKCILKGTKPEELDECSKRFLWSE